jgi:hypothetical protein
MTAKQQPPRYNTRPESPAAKRAAGTSGASPTTPPRPRKSSRPGRRSEVPPPVDKDNEDKGSPE